MLDNFGSDDIYDHITMVAKFDTNHSPTDPSDFADDVLYIEDHGLLDLTSAPGRAVRQTQASLWGPRATKALLLTSMITR